MSLLQHQICLCVCVCPRLNWNKWKKIDEYFKNYFISDERENTRALIYTRPPSNIISDEFRIKTCFNCTDCDVTWSRDSMLQFLLFYVCCKDFRDYLFCLIYLPTCDQFKLFEVLEVLEFQSDFQFELKQREFKLNVALLSCPKVFD